MRSPCDGSKAIARIPVDWKPGAGIIGATTKQTLIYPEFEGYIIDEVEYDPVTRRALEYGSFYPLQEIPFGD